MVIALSLSDTHTHMTLHTQTHTHSLFLSNFSCILCSLNTSHISLFTILSLGYRVCLERKCVCMHVWKREKERKRKSERGFRSFRVSLGKKRRLSENGKERGQHLSGRPTAFRGANDRWMLLLDASHLLSLNTVGLFRLSQQSWWPFLTVVMALESRQESENQPSRNHNKAETRQEPKEKEEEDEDVNFLML